MRIKYCGITRACDAEYALDLGVDALGFIFYSKSPRYVSLKSAVEIAQQIPPFVTRVAVTVNATDQEVEQIRDSGSFDCIQLHGDESVERCRELAPTKLIKALGVPLADGILVDAFPVSAVLLDKASVKRGGTGEVIDWGVAAEIRQRVNLPVILSGGLTVENVKKAVEIVQPYGIDVCSGIESAPGVKDHLKMQEFIRECRQ